MGAFDTSHGRSWAVRLGVLALGVGVLAGCDEGSTDPGEEDPGDASVVATVTADGSAAQGVTVGLYTVGGAASLQTATTGMAGAATFTMLEAGRYDVEVEVPTGLNVAAGDDDRKTVNVAESAEAAVSFALTSEAPVEPADTVVIEAVNFSFSPSQVTIAPNTLVRWVNTTSTFHTVTPDGHSEWADASLSSSGSTFEHVFMNEGTFPYFCSPHQSAGMTGTITVTAP